MNERVLCGDSASALCWTSSFPVMFVTVAHVRFVMLGGRSGGNVGSPRDGKQLLFRVPRCGLLFLVQSCHHYPGHLEGPEGGMMSPGCVWAGTVAWRLVCVLVLIVAWEGTLLICTERMGTVVWSSFVDCLVSSVIMFR